MNEDTPMDKAEVERAAILARQMAEENGFIYWPGGDAAPPDWDEGPYLCRDGKTYWMCGYDWKHGTGCWNPIASWDRIGYRTHLQGQQQ